MWRLAYGVLEISIAVFVVFPVTSLSGDFCYIAEGSGFLVDVEAAWNIHEIEFERSLSEVLSTFMSKSYMTSETALG